MIDLYNIHETARKLKIADVTLRRLIKARAIPFHRIGHKYFFTDADINDFLVKVSHPIIEA
jgi:excisionase family DNA binding protein